MNKGRTLYVLCPKQIGIGLLLIIVIQITSYILVSLDTEMFAQLSVPR